MSKKNHLFSILPTGLILASLSGCVSLPTMEQKQAETKECAVNFQTTGSSLSLTGKEYITKFFVSNLSKNDAMMRASKKLAEDGLDVKTSDKEGGFLKASNRVIGGSGSQTDAGLFMSFDQIKGGVNISIKYSTSFGQIASEENMRFNFCEIADAISTRRGAEPAVTTPTKSKEVKKVSSSSATANTSASSTSSSLTTPTKKKESGPVPNFKDFSNSK